MRNIVLAFVLLFAFPGYAMSNRPISTVPETTTPAQGDYMLVTINPLTSPASRNATIANILKNGPWIFSGTNVILQTSTQNVGIGTSVATHKLEVVGNAYVTGDITCGGSCGGQVLDLGNISQSLLPDTDNIYDIGSSERAWKDLYVDGVIYTPLTGARCVQTASDGSLVVAADACGTGGSSQWVGTSPIYYDYDVGIGSVTPRGKLDVDGNVYGTAFYGSGANLTNLPAVDLSLYAKLVGPHFTGNVGVGSASPRAVLDVNGAIYGTYYYGDGSQLTGIGTSSMVYPGVGIAVSTGSAWTTSLTDSHSNWDTAYTDRLKWDGGATGLVAATGRSSLGLVIGTNVQAYNSYLTGINQNLTKTSAVQFNGVTSDLTGNASTATALQTARTINGKLFNGTANITITQGDIDLSLYATKALYVPQTTTVNSKALNGNIVLNQGDIDLSLYAKTSALSGYVPTTRTINNKALSSNVTLTQGDIDLSLYATTALYVPKTTTVNSKALSGNIVLSQSDIDLSLYGKLAGPHFTGNVGIGSASPRGTLDVDGEIYGTKITLGSGVSVDASVYAGVELDGQIYAPDIQVISGNTVCYNATTHSFYVKSSCP